MTILAYIVLLLIAITNIMVCVFMARNITHNASDFARGKPLFWLGVAYRVVLNGLAMYTTWTVIASLINLTTALVYAGGLDQTACCIASLTLLVVFHVTWFCLENFVWDRYAR
jgi:Na+(H+)/acetate symporter ActP